MLDCRFTSGAELRVNMLRHVMHEAYSRDRRLTTFLKRCARAAYWNDPKWLRILAWIIIVRAHNFRLADDDRKHCTGNRTTVILRVPGAGDPQKGQGLT